MDTNEIVMFEDKNKSILDLIVNDYFDFQFHDISLKQLYTKMRKLKNIDDDFKQVNQLYEKTIFPKIKNSLNTIESPYLTNIFKYYFNQYSNDKYKQKCLLLIILNHQEDILKELESFIFKLIKTNRLGISNSIKSTFSNEVTTSKEYELFLKKLSKWHCHIEFINFYIDYLLTYYNKEFVFKKDLFSIENNKGSYFGIFAKKSLFKLSSTICSHLHLTPNIDYSKLLLFITLSLQTGFSWTNLLRFFPQSQLNNIATSLTVNFLIGKISSILQYQSLFVEFRTISDNIEKLNMNLFKIESFLYQLIILEIQNELDEKLKINNEKLKENIIKLGSKIEKYLIDVNYDEEIQTKIEEEYVELTSLISSEEIENSYVLVNMSPNE